MALTSESCRALIGLVLAILIAALAPPSWAGPPRSKAVIAQFKRANPCPVNGATRGACPGWQVDHVQPLCAGGPDATANLQWLTVADHKAKTRLDRLLCARSRRVITIDEMRP